LPEGENYVCQSPQNCPLTKQGLYLKLKKTLYGLRRSPRHFYDLAKKTLEAVGLKAHPSSPCLFSGTLIKGQPPLYLGLYVDDFIYFSESDQVDNVASCVQWAHAMATKGLRHITIQDSAVCESVQNEFIDIKHVAGKVNLSDMFTKEEKNAEHFIVIRDFVLTDSNDF
jgi:hypothetical protein